MIYAKPYTIYLRGTISLPVFWADSRVVEFLARYGLGLT